MFSAGRGRDAKKSRYHNGILRKMRQRKRKSLPHDTVQVPWMSRQEWKIFTTGIGVIHMRNELCKVPFSNW